jgi:hypothetical protein
MQSPQLRSLLAQVRHEVKLRQTAPAAHCSAHSRAARSPSPGTMTHRSDEGQK